MSEYNIPTPEERRRQRLEEGQQTNKANGIMRAIFGIIMIIIYVGMGVLLLINYFGWSADWNIARYIVGPVLIVYGLFRAWRQIKGID